MLQQAPDGHTLAATRNPMKARMLHINPNENCWWICTSAENTLPIQLLLSLKWKGKPSLEKDQAPFPCQWLKDNRGVKSVSGHRLYEAPLLATPSCPALLQPYSQHFSLCVQGLTLMTLSHDCSPQIYFSKPFFKMFKSVYQEGTLASSKFSKCTILGEILIPSISRTCIQTENEEHRIHEDEVRKWEERVLEQTKKTSASSLLCSLINKNGKYHICI